VARAKKRKDHKRGTIMSRIFYSKVIWSDLLVEMMKQPEKKRLEWITKLVVEMADGDIANCDTKYGQRLMKESIEYRERKSIAGKKGMSKRWSKVVPIGME
jgi:hypothetical protein